ncbi:MAG: nicotinate phosphoribosyltransferase [Oscillospiraceae bacterium]|jgi:nicotinate phosphoribosyltransferase|nr:nicotinate phosphoribosyltransferase [Oscillospiraceae bacterium]
MNASLVCDYYELTMAGGYFAAGMSEKTAYFDLFFRSVPDGGGYAVAAGLREAAEYAAGLRFSSEDIDYLHSLGAFNDDFLRYLLSFRFTGDIYAVPEGTPVFPGEPLLTVKAPIIEAQLLETYLLLTVNHQSLVATKASRIARAAAGRPVTDFGARRAHGESAAVLGARAAYIGGCAGTSCTEAARLFGLPHGGTMAHSWVMLFPGEYEAFTAYIAQYPDKPTLLVDTYNTLGSGVPNAIRAFTQSGVTEGAIRLDSGDLAALSKKARAALNLAGLERIRIVASGSLDEHAIRALIARGACIDAFGVGERLITSQSDPVFTGVYKLAAVETDGVITPAVKISDTPQKHTMPHYKRLYRLYSAESGKALADCLRLHSENPPALRGAATRELHGIVVKNGELTSPAPDARAVRDYCAEQLSTLPEGVKRLNNPAAYRVRPSRKLISAARKARRR